MNFRTSLVVQWLRLCASSAGIMGLIPGQRSKTPHAEQQGQKKGKKTKRNFNRQQVKSENVHLVRLLTGVRE